MSVGEEARRPEFVRGDATGLAIPAHAEALRAAGPAFLTDALRTFGSLSMSNRVVAITRFDAFSGGNSGHKVLMSLAYEQAQPTLHTNLFVKFSRDFDDAFRDRRRYELEAEVRLAQLSRSPNFPVSVPTAYFADFNHASGTGLLITQQIAFGDGHIEPLHPKCMDHELRDPLEYYRATFTALAQLAAAHKSGALSPQVETLFPFDPQAAEADLPIPWNEQQLRERIHRFAAFARQSPQLFPAHLTDPAFIAKFEREAVQALQHEAAIKRFLHASPDFIALCHWNTHIDNAWFWRDERDVVHCGLLDWGMVRQMNVAYGLWGGLCGADLTIWNEHLEELLQVFVSVLHARGGPQLESRELGHHLNLSIAMLGLALLMDAPALVLERLPEAAHASGPLDPVMHKNEIARSFLHVFTAFLHVWATRDMASSLDHAIGSR